MLNLRSFRATPISLLFLLKFGIVLCWVGWAVLYSLTVSINIPTSHMDGAFQTASGLHRLDAEQAPGRDFYPYLGIGPLFVLYPFFKLFGANISASVFSSHLTVLIFVMLSVAFICHLMWRPKSYLTSLAAGTLLFSASIAPVVISRYLSCVAIPDFVGWGINLPNFTWWGLSPGNSLRPLRSAAPYLAAIILYFYVLRISVARTKYILSGVLMGLIMLWSNDYAISTAGLLIMFVLAHALGRSEFRLRNVLIYLGSAVISWLLLLTLATHGHPIELLRYNFIDVAREQWWFFGPYGESARINSFGQLERLFNAYNSFSLFVLAFMAILTVRTRLVEHALLAWIGAALFAGGVVSSVGGHMGDYYFNAFQYWGMMVAIAGLGRLIWLSTRRFASNDYNYKLHRLFAALCISALLMGSSFTQYRAEFSSAKNDSYRFFVPELGGYLANEWKDYVELARSTPENQSVFEEYWGLWSAILRKFPAWPVDSVIHTFGTAREVARQQMPHADIVISTQYSMSPLYQPWNLSQSYWFYENLLKEWTVSYLSPTTVVWRRDKNLHPLEPAKCTVNSDSQSLNVQVSTPGLYEIEMRYKLVGSGRFLSLIKNNISIDDLANGFVSVDPNGTQVKFPAYFNAAGNGELGTRVIGGNDVRFDITSCNANRLSFDNENVLHISSQADFYLTDGSWVHGISRLWPGFFVPNTQPFISQYTPGRMVSFPSGGKRKIMRVESSGEYLNIFVSGEILDPGKVGLPSGFVTSGNTN